MKERLSKEGSFCVQLESRAGKLEREKSTARTRVCISQLILYRYIIYTARAGPIRLHISMRSRHALTNGFFSRWIMDTSRARLLYFSLSSRVAAAGDVYVYARAFIINERRSADIRCVCSFEVSISFFEIEISFAALVIRGVSVFTRFLYLLFFRF